MKPIPGFEGYCVDSHGNVWSEKRGIVLKAWYHFSMQNIYKRVGLYKQGKRRLIFVHELVALAYIGPKPKGKIVHHKDHDTFNNNYKNLTYVSASQNAAYAYKFYKANGAA